MFEEDDPLNEFCVDQRSSVTVTSTFDQNDPKYWCCCDLIHISLAAKIVSIFYIAIALLSIIGSLAQSPANSINVIVPAACAIAIFGLLFHGVFKEKQKLLLPYIIFQAVSIGITALFIVCFLITAEVSKATLEQFANKFNVLRAENEFADLQLFIILFVMFLIFTLIIQMCTLDIIYRFKQYIKDRETSFTFNLDGIFQTAGSGVFSLPPPAYKLSY